MERPALQDLLADIPASIDIVVEWRTSRHCSIAAQRPKNPRKLQGSAALRPKTPQGHRPGHRLAAAQGRPTGWLHSTALPPPLDRNHGSPSLSASPAPDPLFEVEYLGLRAEPRARVRWDETHEPESPNEQ